MSSVGVYNVSESHHFTGVMYSKFNFLKICITSAKGIK